MLCYIILTCSWDAGVKNQAYYRRIAMGSFTGYTHTLHVLSSCMSG